VVATDDTPLKIALMGINERDRARLEYFKTQQWSYNRLVVAEAKTNFCNPDRNAPDGQKLLQHPPDHNSSSPLILRSLRWKDIFQLFEQLHSRHNSHENACKVMEEEALWLPLHTPVKSTQDHHPDSTTGSVSSSRLEFFSRTTDDPYLYHSAPIDQNKEIANLRLELVAALEGKRQSDLQHRQTQNELHQVKTQLADLEESSDIFQKQSAESITRLTEERFNLECSLRQLQEQRSGNNEIEQRQIATLQQSLTGAQKEQKQTQASNQQKVRELQALLDEANANSELITVSLNNQIKQLRQSQASLEQALDESRARSAQVHAEHNQRESSLQAELDETKKNAEQKVNALKIEIKQLRKNHSLMAQALEDNQALLDQAQTEHQQRESNLQSALDEANRTLNEKRSRIEAEFQQQIKSLDEHKQRLEKELAEKEQASSQAEIDHQKALASLKNELNQALDNSTKLGQSRRQLAEALEQAKAESQAQQEHQKQALEAAKQQASEERSRFKKQVEDLNTEQEESRAKIKQLRKKLLIMKTHLEHKQRKSKHLESLLKSKEEDMESLKLCLSVEEQDQKELHAELQELIKENQLTWERASESDIAMQVAKQELSSIKRELGQENAVLRAELEHQKESSELSQSWQSEEIERLLQSLSEYQAAQKTADATIRSLKSDHQSLLEAKSEFNKQLEQLKAESNAKQSELSSIIKSGRQEIALLRKKLDSANVRNIDPVEFEKLRQALRHAEDEKASLKLQIEELHQVQLEIERQLSMEKQTRMQRPYSRAMNKNKQKKMRGSSSRTTSKDNRTLPMKRQSKNSTIVRNCSGRSRLQQLSGARARPGLLRFY
jgi:chromosome segregation ATPase